MISERGQGLPLENDCDSSLTETSLPLWACGGWDCHVSHPCPIPSPQSKASMINMRPFYMCCPNTTRVNCRQERVCTCVVFAQDPPPQKKKKQKYAKMQRVCWVLQTYQGHMQMSEKSGFVMHSYNRQTNLSAPTHHSCGHLFVFC